MPQTAKAERLAGHVRNALRAGSLASGVPRPFERAPKRPATIQCATVSGITHPHRSAKQIGEDMHLFIADLFEREFIPECYGLSEAFSEYHVQRYIGTYEIDGQIEEVMLRGRVDLLAVGMTGVEGIGSTLTYYIGEVKPESQEHMPRHWGAGYRQLGDYQRMIESAHDGIRVERLTQWRPRSPVPLDRLPEYRDHELLIRHAGDGLYLYRGRRRR